MRLTRTTIEVLASLACAAALAPSVGVDVAAADELSFGPSVSVAQSYDDNLFLTSTDTKSSWFWRVEPALRVGLRAPTFKLQGSYSFDSEIYPAPYDALSNVVERQGADLNARWQLDDQLDWHAIGLVHQSNDSRDLAFALPNGLDLGRRSGLVLDLGTGFTDKLSRRAEVSADYSFQRVDDEGAGATDSHAEQLVVSWRWSREITIGAGVLGRENHLEMGWENDVLPTLRLAATLSPSLSFKLVAGPRLGESGYQTMEGLAAATWNVRPLAIEVSASRAETVIPGVPAPLDTDGVELKGSWKLGKTTLWLGPAYFHSAAMSFDAEAFQIDSGVDAPLYGWLALFGTYRLTWQQVNGIGAASARDQLFLVGLTARLPDEQLRRPL